MNEIVEKVLKNYLDANGRIKIPDGAKRVKLDVGLAFNAPNSELWLEKDNDLCVYGFEPNPYNVNFIKQKFNPIGDRYGELVHLEPSRIGKTFFIIEAALSDDEPTYSKFYCTKDDPGTSSIYQPTYFEIEDVSLVSVIRLQDFFDLFPWDKIPYIEQLKTDTQSSDFNVIRGCGKYLSEKVVYLDVEMSTYGQYRHDENPEEFHNYIIEMGFQPMRIGGNSSYYNKRFTTKLDEIHYQFQDC